MLYVKGKLETIAIDYDNVFAKCPDCGALHKIDLVETLDIAQDVHTAVFCEKCTKQREEEGREEERLMCDYCEHCKEVLPGADICGKTGAFVLLDSVQTDHYYHCEGKEFGYAEVLPKNEDTCYQCEHHWVDENINDVCRKSGQVIARQGEETIDFNWCKGKFFEEMED